MENWKIYGEGIVPKGKYSGNLFYKEGVKPIIELKSWNNGKIMFYVKFEFNQVYSVRVFEEGAAFNEIFEDIMKFPPDRSINVIYEVEDGDYARDVRKIVGKKLTGARIYQYVILTENYFFEVVSDSEPMITLIEEKAEKEIRIKYQDDYRQGEVDVIFKHLEEPVYMSKSGSFYEADVELTKGEYYYKYLGEDGLELIDKKNKDIFIDESGCWSVLTIDEDGVVEKEIESSATLTEYGISHKKMEVVSDKAESKVFDVNKDKEAVCLLSFNEIKGLHVVTVAWYNPSGELYKFAENDFGSYEEADDDKVMVRFWLNLAGIDEADFGNWTVRAFLDGEMIKEDNIVISKNDTGKIDELC